MSETGEAPPRVAIVGGGPKGFYCLERLLSEAAEHGHALRVDVYEQSGQFGAGAVYSPAQPSYLRMNFADSQLDVWPQRASLVPAELRRSFLQWCERSGTLDPSGYSPRSLVGSYLAESFATLLGAAPSTVEVTLRDRAVTSLELEDHRWQLRSGEESRHYERILLATGHRPPLPPAPGLPQPISYPLPAALSRVRSGPDGNVLIRGMALTFIDVALELTEGRGGRFEGADDGRSPLQYRPSRAEPETIASFSRTGRPMLTKPQPGAVLEVEVVAEIADRGQARLRELDDADFTAALITTIGETGAELLGAAGPGPGADAGALADHLRAVIGGPAWNQVSSRELVERSWAVACGRRSPDEWWALGESWRCLYPALVSRGSHGGIPDAEWPRFAQVAREMERVAFGPPPITTAKLLALIDAGAVHLGPEPGHTPPATLYAVLPPPGAAEPRGDLVDVLMRAGWIRCASGGRRGIEVDRAGGCIGADGSPTPGLAAVGRVTEDWVIGNDTLSRALHPHPDRWAREVVRS